MKVAQLSCWILFAFVCSRLGAANASGSGVRTVNAAAIGSIAALHAFLTTSTGPDGASPAAGLVADAAGHLYGTTVWDGSSDCGTVFELTPPAPGQNAWTETVLHSFTFDGTDGIYPQGRLVADAHGALYGMTPSGGAHRAGVVFQLTPPAPGTDGWTEHIIHTFERLDGSDPYAGLIIDAAGALYGTTGSGGTRNQGTVFKLLPPAPGQTAWTETVLHSFAPAGGDGSGPTGDLFADSAGNLYGTTDVGGTVGGCPANANYGCGTVFKLSPPPPGQSAWTETVLHSFTFADGAYPRAGLIADARGNLYGTTSDGGPPFCKGKFDFETCGTVFELSPPPAGETAWKNHVLHLFVDARGDGNFPESTLIADAAGALYGTTVFGGTAPRCSGQQRRLPYNCGTVFKLTPPPAGQTGWTETLVYSFDQTGSGGAQLRGGLLADAHGTLYGTAFYGGGTPHCSLVLQQQPQYCGTVFALSATGFAVRSMSSLPMRAPNNLGHLP